MYVWHKIPSYTFPLSLPPIECANVCVCDFLTWKLDDEIKFSPSSRSFQFDWQTHIKKHPHIIWYELAIRKRNGRSVDATKKLRRFRSDDGKRVAKMCRWSVPFQRHNQAHIQINFPEKGIRLQTCLSLFLSVKHINMYSYSVRCANDCKLIKIIGAEPTGANGHGVHTPNANWRGECWRPFTLYISAMQKPTQIHQ